MCLVMSVSRPVVGADCAGGCSPARIRCFLRTVVLIQCIVRLRRKKWRQKKVEDVSTFYFGLLVYILSRILEVRRKSACFWASTIQDPDPLVRAMNPAPDPSLFSYMC
jgi:hypothetical protein